MREDQLTDEEFNEFVLPELAQIIQMAMEEEGESVSVDAESLRRILAFAGSQRVHGDEQPPVVPDSPLSKRLYKSFCEMTQRTKAPEEISPGRWYDREAVRRDGRRGKWVPAPDRQQGQQSPSQRQEEVHHGPTWSDISQEYQTPAKWIEATFETEEARDAARNTPEYRQMIEDWLAERDADWEQGVPAEGVRYGDSRWLKQRDPNHPVATKIRENRKASQIMNRFRMEFEQLGDVTGVGSKLRELEEYLKIYEGLYTDEEWMSLKPDDPAWQKRLGIVRELTDLRQRAVEKPRKLVARILAEANGNQWYSDERPSSVAGQDATTHPVTMVTDMFVDQVTRNAIQEIKAAITFQKQPQPEDYESVELTDSVKRKALKGLTWLNSFLPLPPQRIQVMENNRGKNHFFTDMFGQRDVIELASDHTDGEGAQDETMVHEMGHLLERRYPHILKDAIEFLEYRRAGERPVPAVQFLLDEWGETKETVDPILLRNLSATYEHLYLTPNTFKQSFGKGGTERTKGAYAGRSYYVTDNLLSRIPVVGLVADMTRVTLPKLGVFKGCVATEVISSGLQQLYANPVEFFNNDPEYFQFMVATLTQDRRKED